MPSKAGQNHQRSSFAATEEEDEERGRDTQHTLDTQRQDTPKERIQVWVMVDLSWSAGPSERNHARADTFTTICHTAT
jgi:hypothetical protein